MNMSGGSMQFNAANAIFAVGNGLVSSSTVNLSGGTINILGATSQIDIGRSKAPGTFNVSGTGTLNAHQVTIDSSDSTATRSLNISGGTVDLDILTFGTVASPTPRLVDISGGTVNIGALTTGQATGVGSAVTYIHGGNVTLENTVEYFSGSVFRLGSINLAVPANTTYGNATVDVLAGSTLTQTGSFGTGADARTLTKTGPGTLTVNGAQSYATNAVANIMGGTINYNTDAGAGGANLDVNANGGNANFGAPQNLRQIEIAGGGVVNINTTNVSTTALSLDGSPQNYGLTYGSLTSSAAIKSNVYFGGTGIITVGTAGDYNNSGQVDAADYVVWRANSAAFGGSVGYNLWRQNFGALSVPGAGASLGGNQAIPEPGTLLLAVAGVALACVGCQRR
jgi:autotransporter-associated beta strand protein